MDSLASNILEQTTTTIEFVLETRCVKPGMTNEWAGLGIARIHHLETLREFCPQLSRQIFSTTQTDRIVNSCAYNKIIN